MSSLFAPGVHEVVVLIHVLAGVFWLGWMVFMFGLLAPVLRSTVPDRVMDIQRNLQQRIRAVVFWIIPVILLTGLYNMAYRGLLDWEVLTESDLGHRMLLKLGAAMLLFGIYYVAPFIIQWVQRGVSSSEHCHGNPSRRVKKTSIILHIFAFSSGLIAVYLGITIAN
jgi:putative copper export protein